MKNILLIVLLVGMLVISACGGGDNNSNGKEDTYLGGSQGLKIAFAQGAPPETVSDLGGEQAFDIVLDIDNKGEHAVDMDKAELKIVGFPPEAFGKTIDGLTGKPEENIEPRRKNPDGTIIEPPIVQTVFENLAYKYKEPENVEFPIIAKICYNYETNIASTLCIKEDLNKNDESDFCDVSSSRVLSSSGAPVQVTKIMQSPAGKDKTRFTFTVANMDSGKIYKEGAGCEDKTQFKNKVHVEIENLLDRGADEVKCVGLSGGDNSYSGTVSMTSGQSRDVSCTVTMTDRSDRLQPFNIKLSYDYFEDIRTNILVEYTPED